MAIVNDDSDPNGRPAPGDPDPGPAAGNEPIPATDRPAHPIADAEQVPDAPVVDAPEARVAPAAASPVSSVRGQNRVALVATIVAAVALIAGGAFLLGRGTGGDSSTGGIAASPTAGASINPSAPIPTVVASGDPIAGLPSDGNRLGSADANVVVEYWADYQCPFCARFAQERLPDLFPMIADGSVAVVHRDFAFIGPESLDAAVAVRCAGREGRYWQMHDAVYAAQDGENQGAFARDRLVAIGESVGIDGATMEACFDDRALVVDVLADTSEAVRTAVQSTPTVDINGTRLLGVPEPGQMEAAIDEALAGATPAPTPTQAPISDPWAGIPTSGRVAGDASAPVTVDLWLDYQSTDAATIARDLAPELRTRVTDGSARVVLHDLALLGDESEVAATVVRCAEAQGGPTFLVSDVLSASAQGPGSGIYTPLNLLRFGTQLGLDIRALDACMSDPATAQAIRDETASGQELGLDSGPAVIVSRGGAEVARFSGTIDVQEVLAAIDGEG